MELQRWQCGFQHLCGAPPAAEQRGRQEVQDRRVSKALRGLRELREIRWAASQKAAAVRTLRPEHCGQSTSANGTYDPGGFS